MFSRTCNPICNRKRVFGEFEIKSPSMNGNCAPGKSETEYQECSIMSTCPTEESSTVDINDKDIAELKRKIKSKFGQSQAEIADGAFVSDQVSARSCDSNIKTYKIKLRVDNDYKYYNYNHDFAT